MSAGSSESLALSIPPCTLNGTVRTNNGTCADPTNPLFRSFSSTMVLLVLVTMIAGTVLVSLVTFHLHKSKMRKRKMQRAQEEYERDSGRPKAAARGKPAVRPCVMERPTAVQKSDPKANKEATDSAGIPEKECTDDNTRHTRSQTRRDHLLESVAVS